MIDFSKMTIDNEITLLDGRLLVVYDPIDKSKESFFDENGKRIIPTISEVVNREIFLFAKDGSIIWQIEEAHPALREQGLGNFSDDAVGDGSYTEIRQERSDFFAFTWSGFKVKIDMDTGKIAYDSWSK